MYYFKALLFEACFLHRKYLLEYKLLKYFFVEKKKRDFFSFFNHKETLTAFPDTSGQTPEIPLNLTQDVSTFPAALLVSVLLEQNKSVNLLKTQQPA